MKKRLVIALVLVSLSAAATYAGPISYSASLSGPAESPPNASPGVGFANVIYDSTLHTLMLHVTFSGLLGTTTASHIHCCTLPTAGVATTTPTIPPSSRRHTRGDTAAMAPVGHRARRARRVMLADHTCQNDPQAA